MTRQVTIGILFGLIVAHIILAFMFAWVTPYRQAGALISYGSPPTKAQDIGAPDERQHANYVTYLLEGKGLPVFNPKDPNLYETYQSHQPPAYYFLAAGWCKVFGATHLNERSSGIRLRALNVLIGAGTVTGVFFLALWGFRHDEVALTAAAMTAFLPMFCALSAAISNDPLLILLCTWVLALLARCLRDGWTWVLAILIGVCTGLAILTKTTAVMLLPVLAIAPFLPAGENKKELDDRRDMEELADWHGPDRRSRDRRVKANPRLLMFCAACIALGMAGPWWSRNQTLYGDPLAMAAFNDAFKGSTQKSDIMLVIEDSTGQGEDSAELSYWEDWVGWWTVRSFYGVFGYMDIWLNEHGTFATGAQRNGNNYPNAVYRLLFAITTLAFFGWLWALAKDEWRETRPVQAMNFIFFLCIFAMFLSFNMHYFQAQARYLYPAIGPITCGFAVGVSTILMKRQQYALPFVALLFFSVNMYALQQLPDAFNKRIEAGSRRQ